MTDGLNIAEWVHMLRCPNNREAYRALQSLQEASDLENAVYAYIDTFIEMMRDSNSYIRTRGLTLIACNAKWDEEGKIDRIIDEYLGHATDNKPIAHPKRYTRYTARSGLHAMRQHQKRKASTNKLTRGIDA